MINPKTKRSRRTEGFFLFLCLFCCFSCKNEMVYNHYQPIEGLLWDKGKEYRFTFRANDTTARYNISFQVRNNNFYPYQNLWIFCTETPPAGMEERRDTVECMLADEFGRWQGKGIALYQSAFPLRTHYVFPRKGSYTFSFRQAMRCDTLGGIPEIGLRIEKVNSVSSRGD